MQKGFNHGKEFVKKKKNSSQEPTDLPFWRGLGKIDSGPRPSNPGNYFQPRNPGQNIRLGNPRPAYRAGIPKKFLRPNNPGQNIRQNNPSQNIRPKNPGQNNRPKNPGQNIRPNNPGQSIRPNNPSQNIGKNSPGSKLGQDRPNKPIQAKQPTKPETPEKDQPIWPEDTDNKGNKFSENTNLPVDDEKIPSGFNTPSQSSQEVQKLTDKMLGPKFKPLSKTERSNLDTSVKNISPIPVKVEAPSIPTLKSNDNPVITVVGGSSKNPNPIVTQQKKILMFQMRMQTMQQEKQRQEKLQTIVANEQAKNNINVTLNVGSNVGMQNWQNNSNITGVTYPMTNVSAEQTMPQREVVETVFNLGHPPHQVIKGLGPKPRSQAHPQKELPLDQWTQIDAFGFRYPKGIPKSFLSQQWQQTTSSETPVSQEPSAWANYTTNTPTMVNPPTSPLLVQTDDQMETQQPYSPSELYTDIEQPGSPEESDTSEKPGQKRLSAFRRLGPQTQTKKPKLTISVTVNEDQEVREVVDETEELKEITPVHLREDIILSTNNIVMKYLKYWPWKRGVVVKRSVTARSSKTVMILEKEQMEEVYEKETLFIQVTVTGYPPNWTKEQVLDVLMENVRGYSFIPCFIEFNYEECKFLTIRCRSALLNLHKTGFVIRKGDVELVITLGQTELTLTQIDFVPRLILRKILHVCLKSETHLDLSAFTLKEDISHFIYFPLNRQDNQTEIVQLQTEITWCWLTELNLSHNKLTTLDGFDLEQSTPKLKHLNLSHNLFGKITFLLKCRTLPLNTINLEGNPFCTDYIDPDQYVKVVKMLFPSIKMIDDIPVKLKGDMPKFIRNYCPEDAKDLSEKFLEVYFPLIDGDIEHRAMLKDMYEEDAIMTVTYHYKLAFGPIYRCFRPLFANARQLEEGDMTMLKGSAAIVKSIVSWPHTEHDPFTFTVDVMYHNDTTTILRVDGILKLTRESLAEDEHLLSFSRTLVLHTRDFVEYKIQSEMLHWSSPTGDYAKSAFAVTTVKTKQMNPNIDATTDEKLQSKLLKIFMKLTTMNKLASERCLEIKKWNLKEALDHFTNLLKLENLESITREDT